MGKVLLSLILVIEGVFFIRAVVTKKTNVKAKEYVRIAVEVILAVLLAVGLLKGVFRYAMLMLVLAAQIVINGISLIRGKEKPYRLSKSVMLLIGNAFLYAFSLFAAFIFPQYREPQVTGEHKVATSLYSWTDESRIETYNDLGEYREVTVEVWYPEEDGKYPLILFDHGGTGVIESNTSTCKELASNGYIVVSIGHPYNSMYIRNTSGKITIADQQYLMDVTMNNGADTPEGEEKVYHLTQEWMALRRADDNFVLNTILEKAAQKEDIFSMVDPDKIGMFGHSMGGAASVEMGRVREDIDAVICLEGTMFGEYDGFENGFETYRDEPYTVPVLDVYSRVIYDAASALENVTYVNFDLAERASDYRFEIIEGAGHMNFTDLPLISPFLAKALGGTGNENYVGVGTVNPLECTETLNAIILEYFDAYLK